MTNEPLTEAAAGNPKMSLRDVAVNRPHWIAGALTLAIAVAVPGPLRADTGDESETGARSGGLTPADTGYYFDASALVTYGALGSFAAVWLLMEPPATPRLFSPDEGGAEFRGDTLPNWSVSLFSAPALAVILAADTETRWYHTKGAVSAFVTTVLLTEITKNLVGRHRPDYDPAHPEAGTPDGRKSFFSGHSSLTVVSTTYLAWYLKNDLFPGLRKPGGGMRWWEIVSYVAIAGATVGVPLSRVVDNRHNPSDVIVGSLVGASVATGFYFWHRHSARKALGGEGGELASSRGQRPGRQILFMPNASLTGASMTFQF